LQGVRRLFAACRQFEEVGYPPPEMDDLTP
jgi:hypothetical protein